MGLTAIMRAKERVGVAPNGRVPQSLPRPLDTEGPIICQIEHHDVRTQTKPDGDCSRLFRRIIQRDALSAIRDIGWSAFRQWLIERSVRKKIIACKGHSGNDTIQ